MALKLFALSLANLWAVLMAQNEGRCPPIGYFWWSHGSVLTNHIVKKYSYLPVEICQAECIKNPNCYAINYKNQTTEGNCEINDATREMFPIDYRKRKGWIYYAISVKPHWTMLQSQPINGWTTPGTSIALNCSTNARPPANGYEFYHNGTLLYKGRSNIYDIASVKMSDDGLYKCVPSNGMGRGEEASIDILVTEWFRLLFPRYDITDYVILRNIITSPLSAVTVCLWVRVSDKYNYGTLFSYSAMATGGSDDEIEIYDYKDLDFYINGEYVPIDLAVNDGHWHHICGTWDNSNGSWAFYKDGQTEKQGMYLKVNKMIAEGGVLVLGQEQDRDGGGFNSGQAFVGEMTNVNVWSRAFSSQEIFAMSRSCVVVQGDVMKWNDVKRHYQGNVQELPLVSCP